MDHVLVYKLTGWLHSAYKEWRYRSEERSTEKNSVGTVFALVMVRFGRTQNRFARETSRELFEENLPIGGELCLILMNVAVTYVKVR